MIVNGYTIKPYADLHGADLYGASLHGAYLRGANLHGAYLIRANLHGAYIHGADLSSANLRGASLRGADLSSANLRGANIRGADLQGANLYNTCVIYLGQRSDSYHFYAQEKQNGEIYILAGCRYFPIREAKAHWKKTRSGTQLGKESLLMCKYAEDMFKIRNEWAKKEK